jgi:hypothetical protein
MKSYRRTNPTSGTTHVGGETPENWLSPPVLAENAEEIRKLGKRVGGDVMEIGRRLTEMKKICRHGNWRP